MATCTRALAWQHIMVACLACKWARQQAEKARACTRHPACLPLQTG